MLSIHLSQEHPVKAGRHMLYLYVKGKLYRTRFFNDLSVKKEEKWIELRTRDNTLTPVSVEESNGFSYLLARDNNASLRLCQPDQGYPDQGLVLYREILSFQNIPFSHLNLRALSLQRALYPVALDQNGKVFFLENAYQNQVSEINTAGVPMKDVLVLNEFLLLEGMNGQLYYIQYYNRTPLNIPNQPKGKLLPLPLPEGVVVRAVIGSGSVLFLLDERGTLYGRGFNEQGQLGLPEPNIVVEWLALSTLPPVRTLALNGSSTFLLTEQGVLYGTGYDLGLFRAKDHSRHTQAWTRIKTPPSAQPLRKVVVGSTYLVLIGEKLYYTSSYSSYQAPESENITSNEPFLPSEWNLISPPEEVLLLEPRGQIRGGALETFYALV